MVMHPDMAGAGITRNANVLPPVQLKKGENRPFEYGAHALYSVATPRMA